MRLTMELPKWLLDVAKVEFFGYTLINANCEW